MPAKGKPKKNPDRVPACEVRHEFGCSGKGTLHLTGVEKGDPVFRCCVGCHAMLRRMGVRTKTYTPPQKPPAPRRR